MNHQSRREFVKSSAVTAAGALVGGFTSTARGYYANETLRIGLMGCGVRTNGRLLPTLQTFPGVKVTAVCDIYDAHLAQVKELVGAPVFATDDFHKLLARDDVDAVIIGSPDHWHVPMAVAACEAGKDVYVEKPLTHSIAEGEAIIAAKNKHQRIVQVGTQQRSMPQFHKAREIVKSGVLGPIHLVRMTWHRNNMPYNRKAENIRPEQVDWKRFCGNAPEQPFNPWIFRNWRWYWDFGGGTLTDLMVHWLDAVNSMLDWELPEEVFTFGDSFVTRGLWQTPDTVQTLMRYPAAKAQAQFTGSIASERDRPGITLHGEDASLFVDRVLLQVKPEARRKVEPVEEVYDPGVNTRLNPTLYGEKLHMNNWLEALRARKEPSATVEAGVLSAHVAHLCNQSYREGRIVRSSA